MINVVAILILSAKFSFLGLLKIKVFWNYSYNVIVFVHGVTNKNLSRDSNCIVYVAVWPKFGSSSISMREAILNSIRIWDLTRKDNSWKGAHGSGSIIWNWQWIWPWDFTPMWQKGANSYVCRSYRGKTDRGLMGNRVKAFDCTLG